MAREARPAIARARPDLPVLAMPHPPPPHVCASPAVPARIVATLREVAPLLAGG